MNATRIVTTLGSITLAGTIALAAIPKGNGVSQSNTPLAAKAAAVSTGKVHRRHASAAHRRHLLAHRRALSTVKHTRHHRRAAHKGTSHKAVAAHHAKNLKSAQ